MPREKWTDERLDDLNKKVDDGFAGVKKDISELRGEMNVRFQGLDARFDSLQRSLFVAAVVVIAAFIGTNAF